MQRIVLEGDTQELLVLTLALRKYHRKKKRSWLWRLIHFRFGIFDKPNLKKHVELPEPVPQEEIMSARARAATRKLQPLQQQHTGDTEAIDLSEIKALR